MKKTTSIILVLVGFALIAASDAGAQTSERTVAFVNVNIGMQPASQTIDSTVSTPVYGQTATAATSLVVGGEPIFDISVGWRFHQKIAAAVGYSTMSSSGTIAGTATVPSPLFFNQYKTVDISGASFNRSDRNIYVVAMWFVPVTNRVEIALVGGPTTTKVKQDLVTGLSVPAGTQNAVATVESQSKNGWGFNVGVDASYLFTKFYGVGIFVRYNGGSVDLPSATDVNFGGFQAGIGARLRF